MFTRRRILDSNPDPDHLSHVDCDPDWSVDCDSDWNVDCDPDWNPIRDPTDSMGTSTGVNISHFSLSSSSSCLACTADSG